MYDFITGHKLASMICDDEEFFQAWVLGEITPFYKGIPQFYESSCPACVLATKNGQPDPFVCDTDPDPETYPELVPGCSRHRDCGFSPLDDVPRIVDRLKYLSFRVDDVERYFTETGTIPVLSGQTFDETWDIVRKAPFMYDPSLTENEVNAQMVYHLYLASMYNAWGKRKIEIVRFVKGEDLTKDSAKKFFQRHVTPLIK